MKKPSLWTEELAASAVDLYLKQGLSAGAIADRPEFAGLSRNAVLGLLFRKGITRARGETGVPRVRKKRYATGAAGPKVRKATTRTVSLSSITGALVARPPSKPGPSEGLVRMTTIQEPAENPVPFDRRERLQCCWPLWPDRLPFREVPEAQRLVCGNVVDADSSRHYCEFHQERSRSCGTLSEQRAVSDGERAAG